MNLGDIIDDRTGFGRWTIPKNDDWLVDMLLGDPHSGNDIPIWPGNDFGDLIRGLETSA